jgi:hypothetical protein
MRVPFIALPVATIDGSIEVRSGWFFFAARTLAASRADDQRLFSERAKKILART